MSPEDHEEKVFKLLTGVFKHYCPEWDFMAIDETWPEFEYCTCFTTSVYDVTRHLRQAALNEMKESGHVS